MRRTGTHLIDLHSHLLPALDDGADCLTTAVEMARAAVGDGITCMVCTPHIRQGLYENTTDRIAGSLAELQGRLTELEIDLTLAAGAEIHVHPRLLGMLADQVAPTIGWTRYVLIELPSQALPPRMMPYFQAIRAAGYIAIIAHPERLAWVETHYSQLLDLVGTGALLQLTGGSLLGEFGGRAMYWSERMLDEGVIDVMASDAHDLTRRPARLAAARDLVSQRLDDISALDLVLHRPARILRDEPLSPNGHRHSKRGSSELPGKKRAAFWSRARSGA